LCLGASAQSLPEPDFPHLGIELKTLPISAALKPLETTYVCTTPLTEITHLQWHDSVVWKKLARVLWVPIISSKGLPITERLVATPFFWSPNSQQQALLQQDWEEFMEQIALGQIDAIRADQGQVLQIRPKAANNKARQLAVGRQGQPIQTLPRGFYLRTQFTQQILQQAFW